MLLRQLLTGIFLFLLFFSVRGQEGLKLKYLNSDQGLSNNSIRCVFQDSKGFIWLGTYDGLNRYDGYEVMVWRNRMDDSTSLPHNYISALNEDDDYNLWVGTGQGVVTYNPVTNDIHPIYYLPHGGVQNEAISDYVSSIEKDGEGNMFIGTSNLGLLIKRKNSEIAIPLSYKDAEGPDKNTYSVRSICTDRHEQIWVFVEGVGLGRYDNKAKRLKIVNPSLSGFSVNKLLSDSSGNLWIGTSRGLLKYNVSKNIVEQHFVAATAQLSANYISAMGITSEGDLWIGTDGGGIDVMDISTGNIRSKYEPGLLSSKTILTIFIDNENRKWVGTNKGGVNVFDIGTNGFETVQPGSVHPNITSNFITSFFEDQKDNLWVGTEGGLHVWDMEHRRFKNYKTSQIANDIVSSITRDTYDNMWVTTFGDGVSRINKNGKIKQYKLINEDNLENKIAILAYCDSKSNLWVTTYESGPLYLFDKPNDKFEVFDPRLVDLMAITEDRDHTLWVGNSSQLIRLDPVNKNHQYFYIGKRVRAIHEDRKGGFWIGVEGGGLVLFDRKQGEIAARYTEEDGLSSNTVMNIVEDKNGYLWISTSNGLNKFNPDSKKINRFYKADGLQSNQFSYRAALGLRSGKLVFGGDNGFNIFDPAEVSVRTVFPKLAITSLKINNKQLSSRYNFKTLNGDLTELKIPYDEAILTIRYAALEYSNPDKINYAYYLEGWDKDWNIGDLRAVTYNNIREGTYLLRIKSTNADAEWGGGELQIAIVVLPPWFRTWWAYLIYFLSLSGLVFLYIKYKSDKDRIKYDLQMAKADEKLRKAELESERMEKEMQKAELDKTRAEFEKEKTEREIEQIKNEKEKEINSKRLSFFTSISHEFRTPLTMIINPVNDLIAQYKYEDKEGLKTIGANAARLLNLSNQLLIFRKIEEGIEDILISKFDYGELCNTVYHYFKYEARTRNIHYTIEGVDAPVFLYGDKNKVEIILYNLIANAFKYIEGAGTVCIKIVKRGKAVETIISDTGIGVPQEVGDAIFGKFYQSKGNVNLGFGIGLYLVKQLTTLHNGSISYRSTPGNGTVFTLSLLLGKSHFDTVSIIEDPGENSCQSSGLATFKYIKEDDPDYVPEIPELKEGGAILVVEDNVEMLNYIASLFENRFVVYKATNGRDGLDIAMGKIPDLIISDIAMPVMDGIELCRRIKNNEIINHLPVILLTAHPSQKLEFEGTNEGADYYITKPFSKRLFMTKVNNLFRNRNYLRQYFYDKVTLSQSTTKEMKVPAEYQDFLDRCIEIVGKYLDDDTFTVEMLAREMAVSHSYLYKRIKLISGQSVNEFIRFLRLRRAAEILITTHNTVAETAYMVGFNDVKYFREQFAKLFSVTPNVYVKQYRNKVVETLRIKH